MRVLTDDKVLIGGFIITGTELKRVLIRGIGPSLNGAGVTLSDPTLELHQGSTTLATNDNWKVRPDATSQQEDIEATTIPPTNDSESAILVMLSPGAYTVILAGKNGGTGVGLVEVYDLGQGANSQLANISTRGFVDTGDNVMIGGLIVGGGSGGGTARVIVRALGPSVPVAGALGDPTLELRDGSGTLVASNDNWKTRPDGSSQQEEIEATTIPPTNDFESALVQDSPGRQLHRHCARDGQHDRRRLGRSLQLAVARRVRKDQKRMKAPLPQKIPTEKSPAFTALLRRRQVAF